MGNGPLRLGLWWQQELGRNTRDGTYFTYPRWKAREGMNVRVSVGALRLLPAGENFPLRAHIRPSDQHLLRTWGVGRPNSSLVLCF